MNSARSRLAVLAALSLAGVVVFVTAERSASALPKHDGAGTKTPTPAALAHTAIGVVVEANENKIPTGGEEMVKALRRLGEVAQLPITFSAVDVHTSLLRPRVIITPRLSTEAYDPRERPGQLGEESPVPGMPGTRLGDPVQTPVGTGRLTEPNIEGRLFLAANFEKKDGGLKVGTFEFISWNSRTLRFDFGYIECDGPEPQLRFVDGVRCFSCHKNRGPILGQGPWSNTPHNDVLRETILAEMEVPLSRSARQKYDEDLGQPHRLDTGFRIGHQLPELTADGLLTVLPQGPAVDAAVRRGADLARDRDVYRAMALYPDGRKGLVLLLSDIAAPGPLERNDQQSAKLLNRIFSEGYGTFAQKWVAIHRNSSNKLVDYNPSGSMGQAIQIVTRTPGPWGRGSTLHASLRVAWSGTPQEIAAYDKKRSESEHKLPSNRRPSNPRAFVRPDPGAPAYPSHAVSGTGLARVIGLTEGDRTFMAEQLAAAAKRVDQPKVTAATLARDVFEGGQFAEVLRTGLIPDREDFKDRFVKGLNETLTGRGATALALERRDYASGPGVAPVPGEEEIPVVATTACVRCHEVQTVAHSRFSPIPLLAFDPFDREKREGWAKGTDAKTRAQVLAKIRQRVVADKDMPPEDSPEHEAFRVKHPAELDALKDWLAAELKKAGGN
jgi:hypothetical protein